MQLTVVGCGDAFGSGGRFNTCYLVESGGKTLALDFGASTLVALKQRGISLNSIDAVVLSHLHGDHFGGLPFLMLDSQFDSRRDKPLTIVGPVGTSERVPALMEAMFPGSSKNKWRFGLDIVDLPCRTRHQMLGFDIETMEVVHPSGAPSTGVRVSDGNRLLAFSGDTQWTERPRRHRGRRRPVHYRVLSVRHAGALSHRLRDHHGKSRPADREGRSC